MAYDHNTFTQTFEPSTGLRQYRAVTMSGSKVGKPSAGAPIVGILVDQGTTGVAASAAARRRVAVQMAGVAKIEATSSTLKAGAQWATSTAGEAIPVAAGHYSQGFVISGSSGGANRILTVSIQPIGTT